MGLLAKLSHKIGDDLVHSNIIEAEDAEIYIYGINQILVSVLNVSSALIIGLLFGTLLEIAVFMVAYIPLRIFAGGYHAKTPLRCYIFSIIMLIIVSLGMKYFPLAEWVYYAISLATTVVVLILSPVEDKNKPLDEIEHRVYQKRTTLIAAAELVIGLVFKITCLDNLSSAVAYSFAMLSAMLIAGKVKNHWLAATFGD